MALCLSASLGWAFMQISINGLDTGCRKKKRKFPIAYFWWAKQHKIPCLVFRKSKQIAHVVGGGAERTPTSYDIILLSSVSAFLLRDYQKLWYHEDCFCPCSLKAK